MWIPSRWDPYLFNLGKRKNGIQIEKTAKMATHSLHALKFLLKVVFESGSSSDAARLVHWQGTEREENSSEVITTLLTSLPAHGGSLITESFAYCPCFLLMLPTWCCSIHTVPASRKNSSHSCCRGSPAAQGLRSNTAEFVLTWTCPLFRYTLQKGKEHLITERALYRKL